MLEQTNSSNQLGITSAKKPGIRFIRIKLGLFISNLKIIQRTCAHIGGEKILFNKDEIEKIKTFDKPSLKLVGFKPIDSLKPYHNIKNSYFICPDDEVY